MQKIAIEKELEREANESSHGNSSLQVKKKGIIDAKNIRKSIFITGAQLQKLDDDEKHKDDKEVNRKRVASQPSSLIHKKLEIDSDV